MLDNYKKVLLTIITVFVLSITFANTGLASQKALTGSGRVVILNDNGTWSYSDPTDVPVFSTPLELNNRAFERSKDADFLVTSNINSTAYWINPKKWIFQKSAPNEDSEYDFDYKDGDIYAMMITERIELKVESLIEIAFDMIREFDPQATVVSKEYRNVNGIKVVFMQMNVTISGGDFTYLGYYYSDTTGSTQLVTYTSTKLVVKYRQEMEEFLNGFVIQND